MKMESSSQQYRDECDDDTKIVVAPVFQGRLEESSERTRNSRSWGMRMMQSFTMPTVATTSRETIVILIYILMGIVLVISALLVIRLVVYRKY